MRWLVVVAFAGAVAWAQPSVESAARDWKRTQSAAARQTLESLRTGPDPQSGAASLALAGSSEEAASLPHLEAAEAKLPLVADYILWLKARVLLRAKQFPAAAQAADLIPRRFPDSPLVARALWLSGKARLEAGDPAGAVRHLSTVRTKLTQPGGDALLAESLEAAGNPAEAVAAYRRVYLAYPRSKEAAEAEKALRRLNAPLGDPGELLGRALRLLEQGDPGRASVEFKAVAPLLAGRDKDLARLKAAVADSQARNTLAAYQALRSLAFADPDLDGERLFHLTGAARRLDKTNDVLEALEDLRDRLPASPWRLEALASAGTYFYNANEQDRAESLFKSCAAAFAAGDKAAYCQWKASFGDYLRRRDARQGFLDLLRKFPASSHASASLYYLGRSYEFAGDLTAAKALYLRASQVFPNHYYSLLCRERLSGGNFAAIQPAARWIADLDKIAWPAIPPPPAFHMGPGLQARAQRADLLARAALDEYAELEIRSGAGDPREAPALAMQLAALAQRRGEPDKGIRWVKNLYPAYFSIPLESAPFDFWRMAYPLPWRQQIEAKAKEHALDPFVVSGLIRQESEFDYDAVSRSNAMGLMQVMPATGRWLSPKAGVSGFYTGLLHQPEVSIQLGTFYLRMLLNSLDNSLEYALASYNAGKGRVDNWRNWFDFREPAEFVESIPIDETRNYVQIVLRNADFYRRLYAGRPGVSTPAPIVAAAAKPAPAAKPVAKRVPSKNANSGRKAPARAATSAAASPSRTAKK